MPVARAPGRARHSLRRGPSTGRGWRVLIQQPNTLRSARGRGEREPTSTSANLTLRSGRSKGGRSGFRPTTTQSSERGVGPSELTSRTEQAFVFGRWPATGSSRELSSIERQALSGACWNGIAFRRRSNVRGTLRRIQVSAAASSAKPTNLALFGATGKEALRLHGNHFGQRVTCGVENEAGPCAPHGRQRVIFGRPGVNHEVFCGGVRGHGVFFGTNRGNVGAATLAT